MDVTENGDTAADRSRHLPAAQPGRRLHQAGLPAAPAGRGTSPPGTSLKLRAARRRTRPTRATPRARPRRGVDPGQEPRTARADDPKHRAATVACRRRRWRSTCRRTTRCARNVTPAAPSAPHALERRHPNAMVCSRWRGNAITGGDRQHATRLQQKNADGGWTRSRAASRVPNTPSPTAAPRQKGHGRYRVSTSNESPESEPSAASSEVKVDEDRAKRSSRERLTRTGLRGRRGLVQGQRGSVVQLERRPEARRRKCGERREPVQLRHDRVAADVRHEWLAHRVWDR